MNALIGRIFFCTCMAKERDPKHRPSVKDNSPPHLKTRQPATPNAYISDNRICNNINELKNELSNIQESQSRNSTSIFELRIDEDPSEAKVNAEKAGDKMHGNNEEILTEVRGKISYEDVPFSNFHNQINHDLFRIETAPKRSKPSPVPLQRKVEAVSKNAANQNLEEKISTNSKTDINELLSCSHDQRYTGVQPLLPPPKRRSVNKKDSETNNKMRSNEPENSIQSNTNKVNDCDWGWLSMAPSTSRRKKLRLNDTSMSTAVSESSDKNKVSKNDLHEVAEWDDMPLEKFVTPGGVTFMIKQSSKNTEPFKTELWKHLGALVGGGNVHFFVPKKEKDINPEIGDRMAPLLQTPKHAMSSSYEKNYHSNCAEKSSMNKYEDEKFFELSESSYKKLITYCRANKLSLNEEIPAYCKNRARRSSRAVDPENDITRLARVIETVEECTWYWGELSGSQARKILNKTKPGTFLLRDSSDSRYLYSLSIKTRQGPTSIRIVYRDGSFQFDSEMDHRSSRSQHESLVDGTELPPDHPNYVAKRQAPVFKCVVSMVLRYTRHISSRRSSVRKQNMKMIHQNEDDEKDKTHASEKNGDGATPEQFMCYWVNQTGRQEIPVVLAQPKQQRFSSLQDLCRITLSKHLQLWRNDHMIKFLPLPVPIKKFIKKYPYPA